LGSSNIIEDPLPGGDVVFLRQVLQHLSNVQISKIVPKLVQHYDYLVLTEHLPSLKIFVENIDKPPGSDTRISRMSGIVLTSPPFLLRCVSETIACEAPEYGGVVRTVIYRLLGQAQFVAEPGACDASHPSGTARGRDALTSELVQTRHLQDLS
jgi:hypothetical protein